jgi:hypothetical protein
MDQFRKPDNPVRNTASSKSGAPGPLARRAQDRGSPQQGPAMTPEQPIIAKGHDGTVTFDGWWIDIDRRGGIARISAKVNRYSSKRIPLSHVEQVVWKRPSALVNGYLEFVVRGEDRPADTLAAASANLNTVLVTKQQVACFEPLRTALLEALAPNHTTAGTDPVLAPPRTGIAAPQTTSAGQYSGPGRSTVGRGWDGRNRPARETARKHLPKVVWAGLVLGTFFAAAAAVDTEIAVLVLAAALAVGCGWFLISRDREQDRTRPMARGAPADPQGRQRLPGRSGES